MNTRQPRSLFSIFFGVHGVLGLHLTLVLMSAAWVSPAQARKMEGRHEHRAVKTVGSSLGRAASLKRGRVPNALDANTRKLSLDRARVLAAPEPTLASASASAVAQLALSNGDGKKDLFRGPHQGLFLRFDDTVICKFARAETLRAPQDQRYRCTMESGEEVTIIEGEKNAATYAETMGQRFMWALGFTANEAYPIRVICRDCPGRGGDIAPRVAVLLRTVAGTDTRSTDTWNWNELSLVRASAGGATRAHIDAFKLAMAFAQQGAGPAVNQSLACGSEGSAGCARPMLYVSSFANSFGDVALPDGGANLQAWARAPVWENAATCTARLDATADDKHPAALKAPRIGEAGRQQFLAMIKTIEAQQVRNLFASSRVMQRGEKVRTKSGLTRDASLNDWVEIFRRKVVQIETVNGGRGCPQ